MNYKETLEYMYSQLPMFQRIGSAAYKANLDNTLAICGVLNNPEKKFQSIHIAGTNGKGSTSHFLASILQSAGFKVGLYTSPHLKDFRERIKINGKMISEKFVINFIEKYKTNFEFIKPSFFEMTVGLAFEYFANEKVDVAIIETGLGGRLDSTNVISPLLSIITNISFDHTALLGNTLEKIAEEKAGIIKSKTPVIIGEKQEVIQDIFLAKAKESIAPIFFADSIFKAKNLKLTFETSYKLYMDIEKNGQLFYSNLKSELLGLYQQKNIQTVLCATEILNSKGFNLTEEIIRNGIENVISQTGLKGRWQILSESPLIIADTAHNEAGINEVLHQINCTKYQHLHFVLGMVNDKDISKILSFLPKSATYYFCKANIPRALDENELAIAAKEIGLVGNVFTTVISALNAAKLNAHKNDLIFVGGSTFVVAEVI